MTFPSAGETRPSGTYSCNFSLLQFTISSCLYLVRPPALFDFPFFLRLNWQPVLIGMRSCLIWVLKLTFPFECVFGLTSLIRKSLWPWNIQISLDLTTLQLDPTSHRPTSCSPDQHLCLSHPKIWKEWFVLINASSPPLPHSQLFLIISRLTLHAHTAL